MWAFPIHKTMTRRIKLVIWAGVLHEVTKPCMPLNKAFIRLMRLKHNSRDMQQRERKACERERRREARAIQRMNVSQVKLNFVAGLLNRFFGEFLQKF